MEEATVGEGTDGRGAESSMTAPGRAGDGSGDFLVSAPGRSPALDAAELEVLRRYGAERDVAAGEVLFADGDETYDLIVMLDGTAEIIQGYGQPGATFIAGYGRSQFLGEIGMLTGQRAYLTAVATSAGRVLAVPVGQLRAVMASEPGLSDLILRTFLLRHSILMRRGAGLRLIGSRFDPDTRRLLETLARNRLVSTWLDLEASPEAEAILTRCSWRPAGRGSSPSETSAAGQSSAPRPPSAKARWRYGWSSTVSSPPGPQTRYRARRRLTPRFRPKF
jgi:CRP-like cAMP-binding protein